MSSRKDCRELLASLLSTALVGTGLPAQIVTDYQLADLSGQSPVVCVSSGRATHPPFTARGRRARVELVVDVFVLYSDPSGTYTESVAEDVLDAIEAGIAGVVSANQVNDTWSALDYTGPTEVSFLILGGDSYKTERTTLDVEVYS
jgi:hypothetical protein